MADRAWNAGVVLLHDARQGEVRSDAGRGSLSHTVGCEVLGMVQNFAANVGMKTTKAA